MNSIYALVDPVSKEVRYVGKTRNAPSRLTSHLTANKPTHCSRWIQVLKRDGLAPTMMVIEKGLGEDEWPEAEQFWIQYFRFIGANLTNITKGGHDVIRSKAKVESEFYQIPDFEKIIARLCNAHVAKSLHPTMYKEYCEIVRTAHKHDDGLFCYKRGNTVNFLHRKGMLHKTDRCGYVCYLIDKSDRYTATMLVDTDILRRRRLL